MLQSLDQVAALWQGATWAGWIMLAICTALGYAVIMMLYNVFLHPLSHFPGPCHYRASILPWACQALRGRLPFAALGLHEEYGPVVRISPSEISFTDPTAWKDIYGATTGKENPKYHKFYRGISFNGILSDDIIASEKDTHKIIKRNLAEGFSDTSMRRHERLISGHVDFLVQRLHKECEAAGDGWTELDMTDWFSWVTFDIIGNLALGKSFGCLQTLRTTPYLDFMSIATELSGKSLVLWYLGLKLIPTIFMYTFGSQFLSVLDETREILATRLQSGMDKKDLIEPIIRAHKDGELTFNHVVGTANSLIIAGSETNARALAAFAYFMTANPACLARATNEIRSTFYSEDEICLSKVEGLRYLNACIRETLRSYPPIAAALPRMVARGGRVIAGTYIPEGTVVSVAGYAAAHMSQNFQQPFDFAPERFLGETKYEGDTLDASQPFLVGPRSCVGRNLAIASMRLILAKLLWNFDMEGTSESRDWASGQKIYLIWRQKPLPLRLRPARAGVGGVQAAGS